MSLIINTVLSHTDGVALVVSGPSLQELREDYQSSLRTVTDEDMNTFVHAAINDLAPQQLADHPITNEQTAAGATTVVSGNGPTGEADHEEADDDAVSVYSEDELIKGV